MTPDHLFTATVPENATPQQHADLLHSVFTFAHKLLHIVESPAVMALLPPQLRVVAAAVAAIDSAVSDTMADPATQAALSAAMQGGAAETAAVLKGTLDTMNPADSDFGA